MPNLVRLLLYLMVLIVLAATACKQDRGVAPEKEAQKYIGTIVAVGNSLTAGHGVSEENAYPALLENKLIAQGYPYQVINAGISGETSAGALSRINWILTNLEPDIARHYGFDEFGQLSHPFLDKRMIILIKRISSHSAGRSCRLGELGSSLRRLVVEADNDNRSSAF